MTEVENIANEIKRNMPYLKNNYKVKTLGIFGSYVRGEQKQNSDVDLLVEFDEPLSLLDFMTLEGQLSDIIGKKVDLVMKTTLRPRIGERILKEVVYI